MNKKHWATSFSWCTPSLAVPDLFLILNPVKYISINRQNQKIILKEVDSPLCSTSEESEDDLLWETWLEVWDVQPLTLRHTRVGVPVTLHITHRLGGQRADTTWTRLSGTTTRQPHLPWHVTFLQYFHFFVFLLGSLALLLTHSSLLQRNLPPQNL